jgi:hypothetical protein
VHRFLDALGGGQDPLTALQSAKAPRAAAEFVATTWAVLTELPTHCQAAAFAFAREDLIPQMFERVLTSDEAEGRLHTFGEYLKRHISMDGEEHMPMAMAMVAEICGDDHGKWDACARAVTTSMRARSRMWDGVVQAIAADAHPVPWDGSSALTVSMPTLEIDGPTGWRARRRERRAKLSS